ncbi:MAG TPA: hypothetical protein VL485_05755 [Ktedonobacteraceae bacterium]|nr:hypothetical protein [Ktedonobacteraceae bacterium]
MIDIFIVLIAIAIVVGVVASQIYKSVQPLQPNDCSPSGCSGCTLNQVCAARGPRYIRVKDVSSVERNLKIPREHTA